MKNNGIRTICTACCVIIICCSSLPSSLALRLMDAQDDEIMQSHSEPLPRLTRSRMDELKLLSLLLHQQHSSQERLGYGGRSEDVNPNLLSSNVISRELQADDDRETLPEKRQRPCFWSVVTCY